MIDYILMQIPCKNKGFLIFPGNPPAELSELRSIDRRAVWRLKKSTICLNGTITTEPGKIKPHLGPMRLTHGVVGWGRAIRDVPVSGSYGTRKDWWHTTPSYCALMKNDLQLGG